MTKRRHVTPTDDWQQLRLLVGFPEQETYELLRPIVLFGQTAAARADATGVSDRTLDCKADRFDAEGMASLFPPATPALGDRRHIPADIRHRILALKAEHPAFRPHEIAAICRRRDDCRVSHKTVARVLATASLPTLVQRRYPPYAHIPDASRRRLAIVHLYFDGWNIASIAGYLETTRTRVYETLHRFFTEGFAGMPDRSHAPHAPARKADFAAMTAIRRLQVNADLGEWRVHAALRRMGIDLSPRTCGRIMAQNRALGLPRPADPPAHTAQPMPFAAHYRHEYWSVDVRYIEMHGPDDPKPVYVISVLENYSRALLASVIAPRQDLTAFLLVLHAALREHGLSRRNRQRRRRYLPGEPGAGDLRGVGHRATPDRAKAPVAERHREPLQYHAAHGGLPLRTGDDVDRVAGGARPILRRLQPPAALRAPRTRR